MGAMWRTISAKKRQLRCITLRWRIAFLAQGFPIERCGQRQMQQDFSLNLRLLTDHYKSVADVCRRIGINRSQFNKYLGGRSSPSRHVFKRLCDFFGVEEYEMLLPHTEFQKILGSKPLADPASAAEPRYVGYLDQLVRRSRSDLMSYEGYYFEYTYSMTYPGLILRSLILISRDDGLTTYQRMENLAPADGPGRRIKCKYQGIAFYLNDRIFLVDHDSLTKNEISQTVVYPNYQNQLTRLYGLKLGVSTGSRREPLCARVVLEAIGRRIDIRKALQACGTYKPETSDLDPDIKELIINRTSPGEHHFRIDPR